MNAAVVKPAAARKVGLGGITGSPRVFYIMVAVMVLMLGVPLLHNGYYENLFRGILMFATMSLGWNMIGGYVGYVSFGNVVYFGIGTYATALLAQHGLNALLLSVPVAMLVSATFAVLVGLPVLRLRGHYFGIATLGVALAVQEIIANIDVFGGSTGLSIKQSANFSSYYYAMWLVCMASLVATWFIARSKLGYAFVAIRENEDAATVLGIDPTKYKVIAWAISAMMASAAGAVFAGANGFIDPATAFAVDDNIFPIVMALLGGVGTVAGPIAGAFILTAINETLWNHYPKVHTLFFGAVIVIVVLFLPRGLLFLLGMKRGVRSLMDSMRMYRV